METIIFVVSVVIGLPLLAVVAYLVWFFWQTRPRRPKEEEYPHVHVEDDGSAREVTTDERAYLETKFHPADGARPYVKLRYESLNDWGSITGYLPRRQLPKNILIAQAPSTSNKGLIDRSKMIEAHKKAGDTIIENPDGSFTAKLNRNDISEAERKEIFKRALFGRDDEIK
jgi:hypothetical protein